jgi:sugar phosphate isomerase/epimerase
VARPVTLFTGQWADLPLAELAAKAAGWGFDGLELACWGDHFEVDKALADAGYVASASELLERTASRCSASARTSSARRLRPIDDRHRAILPPEVWGDGEPEGVGARAPSG